MTIRRRAVLLALAALMGGALASVPMPDTAHAQDEGGRKRDKPKEREKTAEEKELEAIGKEFKDKDVDALIARIPADVGEGKEGKVRLRLGEDDGNFTRTQAKGIIEKWLESREITRVKLKSTKDLVGTFTLKLRRKLKEAEVELTLVIRIARAEDDTFVLKLIEVQR